MAYGSEISNWLGTVGSFEVGLLGSWGVTPKSWNLDVFLEGFWESYTTRMRYRFPSNLRTKYIFVRLEGQVPGLLFGCCLRAEGSV